MVATTTGKTLSRDYKHVKRHTPGTPAFNGWVGLGVGLAVGLSVALGVYLHFQNTAPAVPLPDADAPPASAKGTEETPVASAVPADADTGTGQDELTFFDLLKTQEVEVPANSAQANPSRRPPMERDITLQAGSFKQMAEAEKLQARLAQYGVRASIQRYAVEDETWFRVRIGPIATVEELDHVRAKLAEAEIEAMPVTAPTLEPPP
jgi:cell division protein FtsN